MSKQVDHTAELMRRLQDMQREQSVISSLNKAFSLVLDKDRFKMTLNQVFKSELSFDSFVILRNFKNGVEVFLSSSNPQKNIDENTLDTYFEQCLHSAEPLLFDLKAIALNTSSAPSYFLDARNAGMRMAAGFGLPSIQDDQNAIFLFYKNFISADDLPERILTGISTQLSVTVRNIIMGGQLNRTQHLTQETKQETIPEQPTPQGFQGIIGESEPMQQIYEQISQVAPSGSNVLIYGETGTGKELVAQAIHGLSSSAHQKMIRINCAAIPANLIESELFGHEKGSFTGATEQRLGKFEQANNSTIFLDEIGELPFELQGRLLRVLQEKEIERIGGNNRIKVNVRIVAATNRNLEKEVAEGNFRSDLFYRLNVFPIYLPSLRERKEDIPLLANYFLEKHHLKAGKKIIGFSQKVINEMSRNPWPGNIRELENMVERSILTSKDSIIKEMEFAKGIAPPQNKDWEFQIKTLQQVEKEYILKVVEKCNGRISGKYGAAVLLGLPSTTLISKMQKLGIQKEHYFDKRNQE
ncbi:sigma-54 interaction domain-containing protein [Chryseobacterium gregarium]|uniref:sigma-54 interaction domain-containing protein n=1 Tax=Chryseobacterium gregarium TaxID=456299 RepID=UPI0003F8595E|nr:sigma-54 dependent transcriptional regulator [Chryseobacterium gregarium]